MPAAINSLAMSTCVELGVQTIAASGLGVEEDDSRAATVEKYDVDSDAAICAAEGVGSTRATSEVEGHFRTDWAWRGPITPAPMMAILKIGFGRFVDIFFLGFPQVFAKAKIYCKRYLNVHRTP